jgi:hypothetical protein
LEVKKKYEALGWKILRNGAPDFLVIKVDEKGTILETKAVEVKAPGSRLTYEQGVYRLVFANAGVEYLVEEVP